MKLGEKVQAKVVERVTGDIFIVNFNGRLMRVKNSTGQKLNANQTVELKVTALDPLAFQISGSHRGYSVQV